MNTDRMDTSTVYGLFEELKQSLTEMASFLKGRSEQQTIDLSKIEELLGKMNTLSKQEVFSPEQIRVLEEILTKSVVAGLEIAFEKLDGIQRKKRLYKPLRRKLMRWAKRVVLSSVKNMFLVLTLRTAKQLSLFAVWDLFFRFLWLETSGKCDKIVNCRIMT